MWKKAIFRNFHQFFAMAPPVGLVETIGLHIRHLRLSFSKI
jgi:hypothetical protein